MAGRKYPQYGIPGHKSTATDSHICSVVSSRCIEYKILTGCYAEHSGSRNFPNFNVEECLPPPPLGVRASQPTKIFELSRRLGQLVLHLEHHLAGLFTWMERAPEQSVMLANTRCLLVSIYSPLRTARIHRKIHLLQQKGLFATKRGPCTLQFEAVFRAETVHSTIQSEALAPAGTLIVARSPIDSTSRAFQRLHSDKYVEEDPVKVAILREGAACRQRRLACPLYLEALRCHRGDGCTLDPPALAGLRRSSLSLSRSCKCQVPPWLHHSKNHSNSVSARVKPQFLFFPPAPVAVHPSSPLVNLPSRPRRLHLLPTQPPSALLTIPLLILLSNQHGSDEQPVRRSVGFGEMARCWTDGVSCRQEGRPNTVPGTNHHDQSIGCFPDRRLHRRTAEINAALA
jgi:hypothetical protein